MISVFQINWRCTDSWIISSKNTLWCLLGCSIGDFGTIAFFQFFQILWNPFLIMALAIVNGLITSIALETLILSRQMKFSSALKTATGMSFLSMVAMELAMNMTDLIIMGEAKLTIEIIPIMLLAGFLAPLPYNYFRLKSLGQSCH